GNQVRFRLGPSGDGGLLRPDRASASRRRLDPPGRPRGRRGGAGAARSEAQARCQSRGGRRLPRGGDLLRAPPGERVSRVAPLRRERRRRLRASRRGGLFRRVVPAVPRARRKDLLRRARSPGAREARPLQGRHDPGRLARGRRALPEVLDSRCPDDRLPRRLGRRALGASARRVRGTGRLSPASRKSALGRKASQLLQGFLGGLALSFAFGGAAAVSERLPVPEDLDDEDLLVVRAVLVHDAVLRKREAQGLRGFLQNGLVVLEGEVADVDAGHVRHKDAPEERVRRGQPAVQVDRGDDRLEAVRQKRELLRASRPRLPRSHPEVPPDPQGAPLRGERRGGDQVRLDLRERAFLEVRKRAIDELPDDKAEYGVSQELETLVVRGGRFAALVGERLVRQGAGEELPVPELVAQDSFEFRCLIEGRVAHRRFGLWAAFRTCACAGGRNRTGTGLSALGILSPVRLPIPPLRPTGHPITPLRARVFETHWSSWISHPDKMRRLMATYPSG